MPVEDGGSGIDLGGPTRNHTSSEAGKPIREGGKPVTVYGTGGCHDAWYSPPEAPKTLRLTWGEKEIVLNLFQAIQLLDFLKVNETALHARAKEIADVLVPHAQKMTIRAREADAGMPGPSMFGPEE